VVITGELYGGFKSDRQSSSELQNFWRLCSLSARLCTLEWTLLGLFLDGNDALKPEETIARRSIYAGVQVYGSSKVY